MTEKSLLAEPHFQNDEAARTTLESVLWPSGPVCPHCGVVDHAYTTMRAGVYRCAEKWCRKDFNVTRGTVMERSKIALHKWLQAFYLVASSKKGVSAHQLHLTLDIGYEAAWFMSYRIREAMRHGGLRPVVGSGKVAKDDKAYHDRLNGKPKRGSSPNYTNTVAVLANRAQAQLDGPKGVSRAVMEVRGEAGSAARQSPGR